MVAEKDSRDDRNLVENLMSLRGLKRLWKLTLSKRGITGRTFPGALYPCLVAI